MFYTLVCTLLGVALGWVPILFHGPIPQKFDLLYINGALGVWCYYSARMVIGFLVGTTTWPERWWLRGPLIGFLTMGPPAIMLVAIPGCGYSCMQWNLTSATLIGTTVAGVARVITGRDHR